MKSKLESGDSLTNEEKDLFACIREVSRQFGGAPILWVTGGWVRDKLLGINPDDIDIIIQNCSPSDFCNKMKEIFPGKVKEVSYFKVRHSSIDDLIVSHVKMMNNMELDIAPITGNSIIDDAMGGDLTINRIHYNIITMKVEDYINGINDLENRIARTPTDAYEAFVEDLVPVIRMIRFSARFGLTIDKSIIESARKARTISKKQLSNEMIIKNISKAIYGPNPAQVIKLLIEMGYFETVFGTKVDHDELLKRIDSMNSGLEIFSLICMIALENDKSLTQKSLTRIACGTKGGDIAYQSLVVPALMNSLDKIKIAGYIKKMGEDWFIGLKIQKDQTNIQSFHDFIVENKLDRFSNHHQLLNFGDIKRILNITTNLNSKQIIDEMFKWEVLNPDGLKDELVANIQSYISSL